MSIKILSKAFTKVYAVLLVAGSLVFTSCEKLLEVDVPVNQMVSESVYSDSLTALASLNGLYSYMYNGTGQLAQSYFSFNASLVPARSADELTYRSANTDEFVTNSITVANGTVSSAWANAYRAVNHANGILEGVSASPLSPSLKQQISGEAKFLRAFCYFTLVNMFGDIPLVLTANVELVKDLPRENTAKVYAQIITDLTEARDQLPPDYSWSGNNRTRVNKWGASALLARVYLYTQQWDMAEAEATKLISQNTLFSLPTLSQAFLKASSEAIFQFYTNVNGYTFTGKELLPGATDIVYILTPQLVASFERDPLRPEGEDDRATEWVKTTTAGLPYAYKYRSNTAGQNTEYEMVLRLAEQYLIRAESRAHQNKLTGAIEDLNVIRTRAGLRGTEAVTKEQILLAIEHERQVELFLEWGHRWFDLKRTGRADAVLSPVKGTAWQSTDVLYPIPASARTINLNLGQNDGY
ncbi:RagB/SusD family nutrient uptake outer membrane protein [Desertivirga brevis]|uniref:RagB/SusD family nutrient uptake outer membrane protein n=1 Tax=Desertivirga brevis TaxID=2810310 RepID=UPI001A95D6FF|nr:RagB/SusD family nutrient uptake outer membrane protein [Pedobacter sp. SYSU D00873]